MLTLNKTWERNTTHKAWWMTLMVAAMLTASLWFAGAASAESPYAATAETMAEAIAQSLGEEAVHSWLRDVLAEAQGTPGINLLDLPDCALLDRLPDDVLSSASRLVESVSLEVSVPVAAHREALRHGAEIELVAVGPFWADEADVERVVAYDRFGHRVWLDPATAPEAVTLVLAAAEAGPSSDDANTYTLAESEPTPADLAVTHAVPALTPEPSRLLAYGDRMMYLWLTQIRVFDTHEPWWKGEPELYILYGRDRETAYRFDLSASESITVEGAWYCIDAPLCAWYSEDESEAIGFWVMEADWGWTMAADLCVGSKDHWLDLCARAELRDLDDSLGSAAVEMADMIEGTLAACAGERWGYFTIPPKHTGGAEFYLADRPMGVQ